MACRQGSARLREDAVLRRSGASGRVAGVAGGPCLHVEVESEMNAKTGMDTM